MIKSRAYLLALLGATAMVAAPAFAQETAAAPESTAASDEIGEIVVTAQRRSESLMKVPVAVRR